MQTYMDLATAQLLTAKLMRSWRAIRRAAGYRPSRRRNVLIEAVLQYIRDAVSEHYDLPEQEPSQTSISRLSLQIEAAQQSHRIVMLATQLIEAEKGFAKDPTQAQLKRAFVGSAISAGQFAGAPLGSASLCMPPLTNAVPLEA